MVRLIQSLAAAATISTVLFAGAGAAQAEQYPWCAVYGGRGGGGTNCGFQTLAQCRETVSGMGGGCEPNLMYQGRETTGRTAGKAKRRAAEQN
jgi:hypothetical protein